MTVFNILQNRARQHNTCCMKFSLCIWCTRTLFVCIVIDVVGNAPVSDIGMCIVCVNLKSIAIRTGTRHTDRTEKRVSDCFHRTACRVVNSTAPCTRLYITPFFIIISIIQFVTAGIIRIHINACRRVCLTFKQSSNNACTAMCAAPCTFNTPTVFIFQLGISWNVAKLVSNAPTQNHCLEILVGWSIP